MAASNWLVGLLLLAVMGIKLLWSVDLLVVAHLTPRLRRRDILRDGAFWLGWFFCTSGIFVYGVLGYLLLKSPNETVPLWFAMPCAAFTIDCVLAWHFLGPAGDRARAE